MPVLKEYADSNDQTGYYIHAPVSGRDHPLPLQTPAVTEEIYREIGYEPTEKGPAGGVKVPNELTWTLYNIGLHWTKNSGPRTDETELDPDDLQEEAGPVLTDANIETILDYTDEYSGQYQAQVNDLRAELGVQTEPASDGQGSGLQEIVESFSEKMDFEEGVEEKLERWEPRSVVPEEDQSDDLFSRFCSTPSEYRTKLANVPELADRLEEYANHPWDVRSVNASRNGSSEGGYHLRTFLDDNSAQPIQGLVVSDYRGIEEELDFSISMSVRRRDFDFDISNGYIADFNARFHEMPVGRFDLPPNDHWWYDNLGKDPEEIMHTLISDFSQLTVILREFFDNFPVYELESTEL